MITRRSSYLGRIERSTTGEVTIQVIADSRQVELREDDEFLTFTTKADLLPEAR